MNTVKNIEFSCRIHKRYWDALQGLTMRQQNDILGALVRAFFTGDSQTEKLKGITRNIYVSLEEPVFFSRVKALAGQKGGVAKAQAKAKQTGKQTPSKALADGVADGKQTGKQTGKQKPSLKENREKRIENIDSVLIVDTTLGVAQTHTINDLISFFTSHGSTEQAARKFEQHYSAQGWKRANGLPITDWKPLAEMWIANDSQAAPTQKPENPETANCPECGLACNPIASGSSLFRCNSCGITWRAEA